MTDTELYKAIYEAAESGQECRLVTVTNVNGSTPARTGMKMLIYPDGSINGTVGGGEIEKLIIERCLGEKIELPVIWKYDLSANEKSSGKFQSTQMECGGTQEVLIEPLFKSSKLYIIGGGHCGIALSRLAKMSGFSVTVIDNRSEWASKEKHPYASKIVCCNYEETSKHILFSENTYIVIMTHGHLHDELVLKNIVNNNYKYLGMIGSGRKVKIVFENLISEGYNKKRIAEIFSPIGFDIGSHTPDEIAIAVLAQIIAVKNNKKEILFNSNPFSNV